jgi:hypothetical protein
MSNMFNYNNNCATAHSNNTMEITMKAWTLLLPLALVACGDKTDDTASESEETTETAFAPQEGGWDVTEPVVTEDTCGMGEEETTGEGTVATLTLTGDAVYSLTIGEDTDSMTFTCTLAGMDLTCDPISESESEPEADMTFTTTFSVSTTFSSETELAGNLGMDMSCEGADCAMLEQFGMTMPCGVAFEFTATAQ